MTEQESAATSVEPAEAEREFLETLRQAAWIFQKEKNGRFLGSIVACQAVARFIYQRGMGAELAGPFLQIAVAFKDLETGGKPRLFSKKTEPHKERERSPERKHTQMLAAMILDVLVKLGDSVNGTADGEASAADMVARHVNDWPGMGAQEIKGITVVNWRKKLNTSKSKEYRTIVAKTLAEPDPRRTVEDLLRNGPPGQFS
jgi:hypothetical protein